MKKYRVTMPIAGAFCINVEALSEEKAIEKAHERLGRISWSEAIKYNSEYDDVSLLGLESHENIVEGNVCCVTHSEVDIEEVG